MNEVVIAAAARTPVGAFGGGLSTVPAHHLGQIAIEEAMRRAEVGPEEVDEVVMGQILAAGAGQNPARQAAVNAGIPVERTAYGVNQLCGSGLRTVALGYQAIRTGDSDVVVAGGHESMSQAPHCVHLRNGTKMGAAELVDTMLRDALFDAFNGYHMGSTAENVAERWQITRGQQDAFAAASQNKAEAAQKAGKFVEEIAPVTVRTRKGESLIDTDEHPKHGTTVETLAKLRPAFAKDGTVTAGNASGINDGAAAIVLMTRENAEKRGVEPLARIVSWATAGVDPAIMGTGPIPASRRALEKAGWSPDDLDLVEANEAFAAQALRGEQGPRLGYRQGQRERRRHRAGASGRRLRRAGADDAALRDAPPRREEGARHALHRRRDGHRDVRGARPARLMGRFRPAIARIDRRTGRWPISPKAVAAGACRRGPRTSRPVGR